MRAVRKEGGACWLTRRLRTFSFVAEVVDDVELQDRRIQMTCLVFGERIELAPFGRVCCIFVLFGFLVWNVIFF